MRMEEATVPLSASLSSRLCAELTETVEDRMANATRTFSV
jgi:hypothetical protein